MHPYIIAKSYTVIFPKPPVIILELIESVDQITAPHTNSPVSHTWVEPDSGYLITWIHLNKLSILSELLWAEIGYLIILVIKN